MYNYFYFISLFFCCNINLSLKKVSFLGSSITAQKEGYVEQLKKHFSKNFDYFGYGFGGIPINPCKFDLAFSLEPDIIVFDWSVLTSAKEKYIEASIQRSESQGAIPVYLIFPVINRTDYRMENLITNLSLKLNFSIIDLRPFFSFEQLSSGLLRDDRHTNPSGAYKYAEIIFNFLNENKFKNPVPLYHVENPFSFAKTKIIKKESYVSSAFNVDGQIVGFFYNVGPYSNFIKLSYNDKISHEFNVFDHFCYYTRMQFLDFQQNLKVTNVTIKVLNREFNRNMNARNINFTLFKPKFEIVEICYTGELKSVHIDSERFD